MDLQHVEVLREKRLLWLPPPIHNPHLEYAAKPPAKHRSPDLPRPTSIDAPPAQFFRGTGSFEQADHLKACSDRRSKKYAQYALRIDPILCRATRARGSMRTTPDSP